MLGKNLQSVSDICFSYISPSNCGNYNHGDLFPIEGHPLGGIRIHICERDPHDKVSGVGDGKYVRDAAQ